MYTSMTVMMSDATLLSVSGCETSIWTKFADFEFPYFLVCACWSLAF
jgi:hypothetical protein